MRRGLQIMLISLSIRGNLKLFSCHVTHVSDDTSLLAVVDNHILNPMSTVYYSGVIIDHRSQINQRPRRSRCFARGLTALSSFFFLRVSKKNILSM